jgi:hypothetical protein
MQTEKASRLKSIEVHATICPQLSKDKTQTKKTITSKKEIKEKKISNRIQKPENGCSKNQNIAAKNKLCTNYIQTQNPSQLKLIQVHSKICAINKTLQQKKLFTNYIQTQKASQL